MIYVGKSSILYFITYCSLGASTFVRDPVCYEDLGCFELNYPWTWLLRAFPAPQSPQTVNTSFYFINRFSRNEKFFETWPKIKFSFEYDANKPSYFITHGYYSDRDTEWMYNLTNSILNKVDANIFSVDWKAGSSTSYMQAASNTRIVGAVITRFITYLEKHYSANLKSFHLMGHSLGSHIMAYVGKSIRGIGRITALDPAQPGFQSQHHSVRLDKGDADFVDVIHTDGKPFVPCLGLGISESVGDVDFFVNGGQYQPNCLLDGKDVNITSLLDIGTLTFDILYNLATCSHTRAPRYMAAAIEKGCLWGHRYNATSSHINFNDFIPNDDCSLDSCTPIGLETEEYPARGNFALETNGIYPFCKDDRISHRNRG